MSSSKTGAPSEPQAKPYSIYTTPEKWFIVALTGFAAMFRCVFVWIEPHVCLLTG